MYFIFFQNFDDMDWHFADTLEKIEDYMENTHIQKDDVGSGRKKRFRLCLQNGQLYRKGF